MSDSQKERSVQRNHVGNQKRRNTSDDINGSVENETSEQSSGSEGEESLTGETNEQEAFKQPRKQGNPKASDYSNKNGL